MERVPLLPPRQHDLPYGVPVLQRSVGLAEIGGVDRRQAARHRRTQLALIDTTARPDSAKRKAVRSLSNLVAATTSDFDKLSERSVGSLIHPSAPEDVRE